MKKIFLMLFFSLFVCCVSKSIIDIGFNSKPINDWSYLYGKFTMTEDSASGILKIRVENLELEDKNLHSGYTKLIEFRSPLAGKYQYSVLAVKPGVYKFHDLFGMFGQGAGNMQITDPIYSRPFKVMKGQCFYLGDFEAYIYSRKYGFKSIKNNYEETTKKFKEYYKNLSKLPTVDVFK